MASRRRLSLSLLLVWLHYPIGYLDGGVYLISIIYNRSSE